MMLIQKDHRPCTPHTIAAQANPTSKAYTCEKKMSTPTLISSTPAASTVGQLRATSFHDSILHYCESTTESISLIILYDTLSRLLPRKRATVPTTRHQLSHGALRVRVQAVLNTAGVLNYTSDRSPSSLVQLPPKHTGILPPELESGLQAVELRQTVPTQCIYDGIYSLKLQ